MVKDGGVLLHPTDTVWGLAAAMSKEAAVEKIYAIKKRERNKPFILLVDSVQRLKMYVHRIHPRLETLLSYHERPLTIIYDKTRGIPAYLKASDGSIGIRIVNEQYCEKIIAEIDEPLVSTSANLSHENTPLSYSDISPAVIEKTDVIFTPEKSLVTKNSKPSVIAKMDANEELIFLRS